MTDPNALVRLRTGTEVPLSVLRATSISLLMLVENNPIALYELVQLCANRDHELFGNTEQVLPKRGLLPLHSAVRDVVLASVSSTGFDMALVDPVANSEGASQ